MLTKHSLPLSSLAIILASLLIEAAARAQTAGLLEPCLEIAPAQWREDLRYFASELPKRHANAFHYISRERFDAEVADLDRRLDRLNGDESYVALERIANLIGDGHTFVQFPRDVGNLPLKIERFGDDYRVTQVAPGLEKALGARVLKVGTVPIGKARELLLALAPQDETPWLAEVRVQHYLTMGLPLHGSGITPERNSALYALQDDNGHEFTMDVKALKPGERPQWVAVFKEPPLFRQRPKERFWYTYLPETKTMYCNFRAYNNLGRVAAELWKQVDEQKPDKLVIDMRQNGGGDYTVGLRHLVRPAKEHAAINKKGHLFVLIGPNTFSAAMSNAAHFRFQTAAMLVGQPIGEKPNSYQEGRRVMLPNSHLNVNYSVKFYKFVESGENAIRPDQEIVPSWAEYKAGRDPVLEWVLRYEAK